MPWLNTRSRCETHHSKASLKWHADQSSVTPMRAVTGRGDPLSRALQHAGRRKKKQLRGRFTAADDGLGENKHLS